MGILNKGGGTDELSNLGLFAQHLDGLGDNRLIEFILGIDGVAPEGHPHHPDTRHNEIPEILKGPMYHFQHSIIPPRYTE